MERLRPSASSTRGALAALICAASLALPASALAAGSMSGSSSSGTAGQIAWVRSAATRFVNAELARSGASACDILYAPLRASHDGRSCEARWSARIAKLLRRPGERRLLHAQLKRIAAAPVSVHGDTATIALATPLMGSSSDSFVWSESCWMLAS